jgi:hypothetical protein
MPRRNGIAGDDYARKLGIQNELASGWEGTQDDIVFVVPYYTKQEPFKPGEYKKAKRPCPCMVFAKFCVDPDQINDRPVTFASRCTWQ